MTKLQLIDKASEIRNYGVNYPIGSNMVAHHYGGYVVLQSYHTLVAIYAMHTETLYVFNYYSNTTSRHVSKFANYVNPIKICYLYKRSDSIVIRSTRTDKKLKLTNVGFEDAISCKWENVIDMSVGW